MNRTVQHITQKLIDLLPGNEEYYRLDELREWGFPGFIVKRIKIELERNLAESMNLPRTDWANLESEAVQEAWQRFVEAIRAEARLPASYAKAVIETAVADVLEMLVQPRKNIPEVIYGTEHILQYEELLSRVKEIVVYRHFATILLRYMEKREADELKKEKCKQIVSAADEKMTRHYSPLNWAQMMDPLFTLIGDSIDTNLLRLFFEDKNLPREARRFDLMEGVVTRAQLIETLSSPELLNFEGYEEDQSTLFDRLKTQQRSASAGKKVNLADVEGTKAGDAELQVDDDADKHLKKAEEEEEEKKEIRQVQKYGGETDDGDAVDILEGQNAKESEDENDEDYPINRLFEDESTSDTAAIAEEEPDHSLNSIFTDEDDDNTLDADGFNDEPDELKGVESTPPESEPEKEREKEEERAGKEIKEDNSAYDIRAFHEKIKKETREPGKDNKAEPEQDNLTENGEGEINSEIEQHKTARPFEQVEGDEEENETMMADFENKAETGESDDEEGVTPMWMRFVDPDEQSELEEEDSHEYSQVEKELPGSGDAEESEEKVTDEDGFIEEPVIDLTEQEASAKKQQETKEKLNEQLSSDRQIFIKKIFGGSEQAFEEAVEDIASYDKWRDASKYIEKEVFKRNLVDMYSEAAVDFTDRLQTYFLKKNKS